MLKSKQHNLEEAVRHAAAFAAFNKQHKPTPSPKDWNKLVQQIGLSAKYQRVPYAFGITLRPIWTSAYKAAQKGHVPGHKVTVPTKKPKASPKPKASEKAKTEAPSEPTPKENVLAAIAALAKAVEAL